MRRFRALARKEALHILRDPRSLLVVFLLPVVMLVLYGYALNMDVTHIALAVLDQDQSSASRELIDAFVRGGVFVERARLADRAEVERTLALRHARAVLVIPHAFARDLARPGGARVQIVVDGSDATTAAVVLNDAELLVAAFTRAATGRQAALAPVIPEPRVWYNPDLKSAHFLVPGLVSVLLMMIAALLTSVAVAREEETGTMEMLLVSPARPVEIILGKVAPYVVLAFVDVLIVVAAGTALFGVPFRGSPWALLAYSGVYVVAAVGLGLLISTMVRTQQQAMMGAQLATTLPSFVLSGFLFPLASMPAPLQWIARIVPARYYVTIIRGIMLKGLPARAFLPEAAYLGALGAALLAISFLRFRLRARAA